MCSPGQRGISPAPSQDPMTIGEQESVTGPWVTVVIRPSVSRKGQPVSSPQLGLIREQESKPSLQAAPSCAFSPVAMRIREQERKPGLQEQESLACKQHLYEFFFYSHLLGVATALGQHQRKSLLT
ncbi:hypothetical protein MDA_GLEAN10010666 [Myotis davidii]|uniref:Uncharacterized protein n=1 Tax=Myotis davidii TaxID=225400 RepID=L5MFK3_MYODS|nr:hypothetical protein MDA_GLEAN10010666 [Myotis davidii]